MNRDAKEEAKVGPIDQRMGEVGRGQKAEPGRCPQGRAGEAEMSVALTPPGEKCLG